MEEWTVYRRFTLDEAKELAIATQELLDATREEVRAEYEWDVDFHAMRVNSKAARIRVRNALQALNREVENR